MRIAKSYVLLLLAVITFFVASTAFAEVAVIPKGGVLENEEENIEPLATPDPRAVKIGNPGVLMKNAEFQDAGRVWISFGHAEAEYGCVPARINYVNQSRSNKGVVISLRMSDYELIRCFGTTFRTEEELNKLAIEGYNALQNGINYSVANNLTLKESDASSYNRILSDLDIDTVAKMDRDELISNLGLKNFLGRTAEQLQILTIDDIYTMTEIDKLMLAHLAGYNFDEFSMSIAEGGLINPGFGIYEIDLHNLPGGYVIPEGAYYVFYELIGYDPDKNELSDFHINLPIVLNVKADLPDEYCQQYGLKIANLVETYTPAVKNNVKTIQ